MQTTKGTGEGKLRTNIEHETQVEQDEERETATRNKHIQHPQVIKIPRTPGDEEKLL